MASQKEFNMLFGLNAKMNSGFTGTFTKAQAEFARLSKEVQGLQKIQSDISSYQKQQGAIDATNSRLKNLKEQQKLVQQAIKETTGSTTLLQQEDLKLDQRIKDTETALERQKQKLGDTSARLKEAGVDTSNLAQKDAELTAKLKELEAEQKKAAEGAASFGEKSVQALSAVQEAFAAAGIAVALREIAQAYMECVGIAGDFEAAISNVEALSGATALEMAALSDQAKELGATTKFTAKESADAMGYMAMAGWDAAEMLQGMDGVLQLAAASGEDLAMVSDIVTDSLSAFGLTAADTAHFSDVLAAAATNSNTNVAIMGETFKMSASVAGALGYSIEDVAMAMGLMANSGVKGSIAGTALRNTFNGLLEGVTLTGDAFGEYEYSAIRADGTMKDFGATIDELRVYFEQMTEAERVSNAMAIAGQRGYNGLLAILNAADEDYVSLSESINNCAGAAQRMAKIKLDNLNGQLTLMNSAGEALKTTFGEQFIPEMRALASLGTDILTGLNRFVQAHPALVKAVTVFVGTLGAVTLGLTAISAATKALKALDMAALFAGPAGAVVAAIAGVTALASAVMYVTEAANEGVPSIAELTEAARGLDRALEAADAAYEETATKTLASADVARAYVDRLEEIEAATGENVENNKEYKDIVSLLARTIPELADSIDLETNSLKVGTDALRDNIDAWEERSKAKAYQDYINSLMDSYNDAVLETAENEIKLTEAQIKADIAAEGIRTTYQKLLTALGMTEEQFKSTYLAVADIPYRSVSEEVASLRSEYLDYERQLEQAENTQRRVTGALEDNREAVDNGKRAVDEAKAAHKQLAETIDGQTAAQAEAVRQNEALQSVMDQTADQLMVIVQAYDEAYNAALSSIEGQYALWDKAADVVAVRAGDINAALESQGDYWRNYNANLQTLSERAADIEGLGDIIASFADGSEESVNAIAGLADAALSSDDDLRALVANWQEVQEEQKAASESIAQFAVDVPDQMKEIEDAMREGVEKLSFADEAAQGAHDTIQAFIAQADEMLPLVRDAWARLGSTANIALAGRFGVNSQMINAFYATGTQSAEPGLALVGEKGPELVYFNGGEKVLTASETEAVIAGQSFREIQAHWPAYETRPAAAALPVENVRAARSAVSVEAVDRRTEVSAPVSIQVSFQIEGNATPETVRALRDYGDDFAERVLEVMEQHSIDLGRGAFR